MATKTMATKKTPPPLMTTPHRDLLRMKKELQVRIREIELDLVGGRDRDPGDLSEPAGMSDDGSSIIAMVKDLHAEIDTAYELREGLEADLAAMTNKLSEEKGLHGEHEAQLRLLEAKAAFGDQLQRDLASEKKTHTDTSRRLDEVTSQLEKVTEERNRLAEQNTTDAARMQEIQGDMDGLETKVSHLETKVAEMGRLRETLAETREDIAEAREQSDRLEEQRQDLKGKLEASEVAKNAIELDLTTTREVVRNQNEHVEELKDILETAEAGLADLRVEFDRQQAENANLVESNQRAEGETRTLNARLEAVEKELDSSKQALRDIHSATVRTTRRVQKRSSDAYGRSNRDRG